MGTCVWGEIHGFRSPAEYQKFVLYMESQVQAGYAKEIFSDPGYQKGLVFGGRWFVDVDSGEKWRLIPPDFPFLGVWEPIGV